jgi:hypothetical protein
MLLAWLMNIDQIACFVMGDGVCVKAVVHVNRFSIYSVTLLVKQTVLES